MIEALAATGEAVGASWFSEAELCYLDAILDRADVIVICHAKYSRGFAQLVAKARARRKRLLYDIDDLVFDDRYVHLILNYLGHSTNDVDMAYWFADFGRYGALMRLCDGVVLTNEYLAERAREFSGRPIAVIPNFMNRLQLDHSARILADKCASGFARNAEIHVGYFSGSPTHRRDFAIVEEALLQLMSADPRVVLLIVGFLEPDHRFARFGERVEVFPLQNILNLQRAIGEVEINLVPLQDNVFTNCKSELKVFEAAAVGTISIASPTFCLSRAIADGKTGFVAPAHLWGQALARAIDRLDSYPEMAMAAAQAALRWFVPEVQGPAVLRALFGDWSGK
jgi:glycosyltransferase involved in cell wall biosynthesis